MRRYSNERKNIDDHYFPIIYIGFEVYILPLIYVIPKSLEICMIMARQESGGASSPVLLKSLVVPKLWEDARMDEVIAYLISSKYLNVPDLFARVINDYAANGN